MQMQMRSTILVGVALLTSLSTSSTTATAPSTSSPLTAPPPLPLHSLRKSTTLFLPLQTFACYPSSISKTIDILSAPCLQQPLLIDTLSTDPFPWSFTPFCYVSKSPHDPALELCVYTDAGFSDGRGISVFTTPEIAREFVRVLGRGVVEGTNNVGREDPTYLTAIPGKGTGTLASRPLSRGDLITAYTPLLLSYREDVLSTPDREIYLRRAVDQLPPRSRKLYYSLAKIYNIDSVIAQDVLKANTFGVEVGGWEHLGVWPETARINHGCGPNSQYRIVGSSLTHFVHAARSIAKDEEVTLTYTNPFHPTDTRQTSLASAFHFACTCPRCASSSDTDMTLRRITSLQSLLSDWTSENHVATIKDAERLIAIYKEDGLDGFLDVPYGHAALMYSAAGDREGVVHYATLAREAVGLKEGVGVGDWGLWDRLIDEPEGHWSWRRRVAKEKKKGAKEQKRQKKPGKKGKGKSNTKAKKG